MMYKNGPYPAPPRQTEAVWRYIEKNGGSSIQYYPGDLTVYEFWISQEEEGLSHKELMERARALLVLAA